MKTKIGECLYPVGPIGLLDAAYIDEGTRTDPRAASFALHHVSPADWYAMRGGGEEPVRGRPQYIALTGQSDTLAIYPAPDKNCELVVRYYPPLMTI